MVGTKVLEEVASEKYFDQIDDLLDFQNDVVEEDGLWGCENFDFDSFPPVWLEESSALPSTGCNNHPSDFSADRHTAPYNDTLQLEWLSNIVQDSLSNSKTFPVCHAKRARSKRPRPATFNPRSAIYLTPPSYFPVSHPLKKRPGQPKKKQKIQSYEQSNNQNEHPSAYPPRMCTHCKTTTTPQWRMGPDGPKTLCNACGVRYKSGRLFPEYRPAGSPTFVPSLHSNSHRKVIEIRNSKNENETVQPDLFEKSDQPFPKYSPAASPAFVPSLNSNSPGKADELRKSKNENETIQPALFQKSDSIFPEYCPAASPTFVPSVNSNYPRKAVEMRKCKNENETIQPALFEKSDSLFPECSPATIPTFLPSLHSNSHQKVVETRKSKNADVTIQPDLFHKSSSYEKSLDISKCTSMVEVPVMIDLTYLPDLIPGSVIVIDSD